jgi:purine-binding chemotaxis protein CheW
MAHQEEENGQDRGRQEINEDMDNKYLTFFLADEVYGVEISYVTEIIGIQKITNIPEMPEYIRGVINLRGKVIPVMDVRTRFHMNQREYDERTCIIVVDISGTTVGLVVDEVSEVADIPMDQVEPPPMGRQGKGNAFIKGMGKSGDSVKILLNVEALIKEEDLEAVMEIE